MNHLIEHAPASIKRSPAAVATLWRASVLLCCCMLPGMAAAAQFIFTFKTTLETSAIAGISIGDTIFLDVVVDNGGTSLLSQTWLNADLVSAKAAAGTYQAVYNPPSFPVLALFTTDSAGGVASAGFFDIDGNNEDPFGVGGLVAFGSDVLRDFNGNLARFSGCVVPPGIGANCSGDASLWSVRPVPLPAAAWLLAGGVGALAGWSRRRPV